MMAPTVVLRDGELVLGLGSAGSNRIRSAILQTVVRAVEQGMPVAEAVEAPRLHFEGGAVQAEPGIDPAALERLEARGLAVVRWPAINLFFGGVQAVARDPADGGAERRRRSAPRRRRGERVSAPDFEAEGLLDGLEGEARAARLGLLEELAGDGVPLAELRDAVAAGRLALVPVEHAIAGDGARYTAREVAAETGLDLELLRQLPRRARRPLHRSRRAARRPRPTSRRRGGRSRSSTPASRPRTCCATRARSGWGWGGSPKPTASSSSAT